MWLVNEPWLWVMWGSARSQSGSKIFDCLANVKELIWTVAEMNTIRLVKANVILRVSELNNVIRVVRSSPANVDNHLNLRLPMFVTGAKTTEMANMAVLHEAVGYATW